MSKSHPNARTRAPRREPTEVVTVRLLQEVCEQLEALANQERRSVSAQVAWFIEQGLAREKA